MMSSYRSLKRLPLTRSSSALVSSFSSSVHASDSKGSIGDDADRILKLFAENGGDASLDLDRPAVVTLTPLLVTDVLKRLRNAGTIALSFFRWAEKQRGFQHTTESYNVLIEALGKIKQFNAVWALVGDMNRRGLLTKDTFALISRRYARARKAMEAIETFERMEKFGMRYESSDFNRLIDILCKSRCVVKAHELFDRMKKTGRFDVDVKTYTILLEGWGQEKNMLRVAEVIREMKDDGFEPDVITYGIIINCYCKDRKYDDAVKVFDEMLEKSYEPTPHIYCTLINGLGSDKRLNEAIKYFEQMKFRGLAPVGPTYNALVGAYCCSGKIDEAYKIVDEMRELGVGPNSRTYDIMLHHLIWAHKTKEAYSLFQRMTGEDDAATCGPTLSTYEIMVRMFCNEGRVDMALRVWDQMKARGILPGMHMFSTLIVSLCEDDRLDDSCKYFREMLDMGIRPPANMFGKLKQSLLDGGRKDTVLSLEKKIQDSRKAPLISSSSSESCPKPALSAKMESLNGTAVHSPKKRKSKEQK